MDLNNNIENNQETQELIDAYLLGTLNTDALNDFKKRMEISPNFRNFVDDQKVLKSAIEENNLKNSLDGFHSEIIESPEKKWLSPSWLALAASFLILISVSTWAILGSGNSAEKIFASNFKPDPGLPTTMGTSSNYEFYYGMVNYKRKEYSEAISRWETLYATNPKNDTLNYFLGVANLANGNPRQAEKYLQTAKEKTESTFYEEAQYYLALTLLKENKIEEAKEALAKSTSASGTLLLNEINAL
ncbi:hypothetical protein Aeqsu_1272 [Aequorivita sublithincola DSM 14238]|uniref:Uncharacterized protein n=1 Tax=Aequorivita sublithincola (strain DSM 14238 / LMG 21431 / ACAM 643 / 9-3) TaxID=746697 RepID=I3YUU7_AEQSU|nr:tetratricopeptide repeat protein [Aequorivita sublithincola]AFL80765.1 hypothetical protein Aeqsu_1272 [Aequorivita sublithincola DSM 14238]